MSVLLLKAPNCPRIVQFRALYLKRWPQLCNFTLLAHRPCPARLFPRTGPLFFQKQELCTGPNIIEQSIRPSHMITALSLLPKSWSFLTFSSNGTYFIPHDRSFVFFESCTKERLELSSPSRSDPLQGQARALLPNI